jgi:hypothetical protein
VDVVDDFQRKIHGTTSLPTRRDIAGWVDRVMTEMKEEVGIVCNAWLKTGYEWFAKEGRGQRRGMILKAIRAPHGARAYP